MKGTDKFLIVLVIGVLLVIVIALVVAAQRPGQEEYQPDDTPEGVVFNYLLAVQQGDFERAYGYLAPDLAHRPANPTAMADDLYWRLEYWERNHPSLSIDSSRTVGDSTVVTVGETRYYQGDLLSSGHSTNTFDVKVRSIAGAWKIVHAEDYWEYDWSSRSDQ